MGFQQDNESPFYSMQPFARTMMKLFKIASVLLCFALLASESFLQAQPPGGRGGPGQGGPGQGGPGGRGVGGQGGPGQGNGQSPPWVRMFDTDGNGEISAEEIANAAAALRKLDRNGDGKLSSTELAAAGGPGQGGAPGRQGQGRPGQGGPGQGGPGQGGPGGGGPGGGGGRGGNQDAAFAAQVMSLDENADGVISLAELPEHMHKAFAIADKDKNNALNQSELLVFAAQFRRDRISPNEAAK